MYSIECTTYYILWFGGFLIEISDGRFLFRIILRTTYSRNEHTCESVKLVPRPLFRWRIRFVLKDGGAQMVTDIINSYRTQYIQINGYYMHESIYDIFFDVIVKITWCTYSSFFSLSLFFISLALRSFSFFQWYRMKDLHSLVSIEMNRAYSRFEGSEL